MSAKKPAKPRAAKRAPAKTPAAAQRTRLGDQARLTAAAQRTRLRLDDHAGLTTAAQLRTFLERVGIALRYGPSASLPLASIYQAVARSGESEQEAQRRATRLTYALIEQGTAVEVNVIAERLALAHESIVPALVALRRRGRSIDELELSDAARRVLEILDEHPRPTAGFVRARFGVAPKQWPNPADDALAELQRELVIDRGATDVPETGAAYLGKDGIPYRLLDAKYVHAASGLSIEEAAELVLDAYLDGALFATRRKLASMFKRCVSVAELNRAIDRMAEKRRIEIVGAGAKELIVSRQ